MTTIPGRPATADPTARPTSAASEATMLIHSRRPVAWVRKIDNAATQVMMPPKKSQECCHADRFDGLPHHHLGTNSEGDHTQDQDLLAVGGSNGQ